MIYQASFLRARYLAARQSCCGWPAPHRAALGHPWARACPALPPAARWAAPSCPHPQAAAPACCWLLLCPGVHALSLPVLASAHRLQSSLPWTRLSGCQCPQWCRLQVVILVVDRGASMPDCGTSTVSVPEIASMHQHRSLDTQSFQTEDTQRSVLKDIKCNHW